MAPDSNGGTDLRRLLWLIAELRKHPSGQIDSSRILYGGQTCDPLLPLIEKWLATHDL